MSTVVEQSTVVFTFHNLTVYSDASVHRAPYDPPPLPPSSSSPHEVATKDLTLNHDHGTWARLLLPPVCHNNNNDNQKLPILLYFHGGGFLIGSTAIPFNQRFLCKLAVEARVLIVSVDYRLAPENPLPAAYEDCFEALLWLNEQAKLGASSADPWLARHADFSRCFLGGDSAGANIAHHVAMKAVGLGFGEDDGGEEKPLGLGLGKMLEHISLQGIILIHPFFSCGASTASASALEANVWKYSGVSNDHPFANPLASGAPPLARAALPRTLVAVAGTDYLRDRGVVYYKALVEAGIDAKLFVSEDEGHVFHLYTPDSKNVPPFLDEIGHFINLPL